MGELYRDFDVAITREGEGYVARVLASPAGPATAPFTLPFEAAELAQFMVAVGPPRMASRRLVPAAARVMDVKDYGSRLGEALLSGDIGKAFRESLTSATSEGRNLRLRLRLDAVPELDPVPWEYVYDSRLDRFLTLSKETPVVRLMDSLEVPPAITVEPPLRVLVMMSSPSDMPELAVAREEQLLRATTGDLVKRGQLELVFLEEATLSELQHALLDDFHVFHFIGHGGFDKESQEGVLVLERPDGTAHRVGGSRLGTLLHDARHLQLAVLNACEGARSSGRDAFSGVAQELVRRGLPAVVAMQTEISDRAALVFSHEFYYFLTRGLPIDAAMSEVRKAMAVSDEASEWGTAVLLRSGADQPFNFTAAAATAAPKREERWEALYEGAQGALAAQAPEAALTMLEQLESERPDYQDVTALIERVRPEVAGEPPSGTGPPTTEGRPPPETPTPPVGPIPGTTPSADATPDRTAPTEHPPPEPPPDHPTGHEEGPRKRRVGLMAGAGALVLALAGGIAWSQLRDDTPPSTDPSPSTSQTVGPSETGQPSSPTTSLDAQAAALEKACGPAPAATPAIAATLPIRCATTTPRIDGDFDEWTDLASVAVVAQVAPTQADQARGLSAVWQGQWDLQAVYIHAQVTDMSLREVDEAQPGSFWKGDSISFEFGPDPRGLDADDPVRNGLDRHVMIGLTGSGAAAAINISGRNTFPAGRLAPSITTSVVRTNLGYELEARVPWSALGIAEAPRRGARYGANLNVSDAAESRTWSLARMISSNPDRTGANQPHPGTWQVLGLADTT